MLEYSSAAKLLDAGIHLVSQFFNIATGTFDTVYKWLAPFPAMQPHIITLTLHEKHSSMPPPALLGIS